MQPKFAIGRQPGKRLGNRLRLDLPAELVMTHGKRKIVIEDVSAGGARVRIDEPLPRGRMGVLHFHELRLYSSVMWSRNGRCGLKFDTPLTHEDMEGFLWIVQHPDAYARICRESGAHDWSSGIGSH